MAAISRAHVSTRQGHQAGSWREAGKRKTWYGRDTLGCKDILPSSPFRYLHGPAETSFQ